MAPGATAPLKEMEVELEAEVMDQLEQVLTRPSFLHALESAASSFMPHRSKPLRGPRGRAPPQLAPPSVPEHPQGSGASGSSSSLDGVSTSNSSASSSPEEAAAEVEQQHEEEDDGWEANGWEALSPEEPDFVAVNRADVLQALAYHIALCLSKHPEAQNMTPQQLQQALSGTFSALKQTRFRQVYRVGRQVYRWSTLTYSALQFYQNPWLVQAVLTALWTFSRVGARALMP